MEETVATATAVIQVKMEFEKIRLGFAAKINEMEEKRREELNRLEETRREELNRLEEERRKELIQLEEKHQEYKNGVNEEFNKTINYIEEKMFEMVTTKQPAQGESLQTPNNSPGDRAQYNRRCKLSVARDRRSSSLPAARSALARPSFTKKSGSIVGFVSPPPLLTRSDGQESSPGIKRGRGRPPLNRPPVLTPMKSPRMASRFRQSTVTPSPMKKSPRMASRFRQSTVTPSPMKGRTPRRTPHINTPSPKIRRRLPRRRPGMITPSPKKKGRPNIYPPNMTQTEYSRVHKMQKEGVQFSEIIERLLQSRGVNGTGGSDSATASGSSQTPPPNEQDSASKKKRLRPRSPRCKKTLTKLREQNKRISPKKRVRKTGGGVRRWTVSVLTGKRRYIKPKPSLPKPKPKPKKRIACNVETCGQTFTRMDTWRRHRRSLHNGERWPCQYCNKLFRWPQNRNKHITRDHADLRDAMFYVKRAQGQAGPRTPALYLCGNVNCNQKFLTMQGRLDHFNDCIKKKDGDPGYVEVEEDSPAASPARPDPQEEDEEEDQDQDEEPATPPPPPASPTPLAPPVPAAPVPEELPEMEKMDEA